MHHRPHFFVDQISHNRAKKGSFMWIIFSGLGLYLLVRGLIAALKSLRSVPRSNRDWIFY
jgi:hypothetical protein